MQTQAATDEVVGRFAPYADGGVLTLGGDSALFDGLDSFDFSGWRSRTRRLESSTLLLLRLRLLLLEQVLPRSSAHRTGTSILGGGLVS